MSKIVFSKVACAKEDSSKWWSFSERRCQVKKYLDSVSIATTFPSENSGTGKRGMLSSESEKIDQFLKLNPEERI